MLLQEDDWRHLLGVHKACMSHAFAKVSESTGIRNP